MRIKTATITKAVSQTARGVFIQVWLAKKRRVVLVVLSFFVIISLTITLHGSTVLQSKAQGASNLIINGAQTYQTVDGIGVNANSAVWNNGELAPAIDQLIDNMGVQNWRLILETTQGWEDSPPPPGFNYDTLYEQPKFQSLWALLGYLKQKNAHSIMINIQGPLPSWYGPNDTISSANEDNWVEMVASMVKYAIINKGLHVDILGPMNEPDNNTIEGPLVSSSQYVRLMHNLSNRLDALGLSSVRLVGPDTVNPSDAIGDYMPAMQADPTIMAKLAHFGFHDYYDSTLGADSQIKNSAYPNKNFWLTEFSDYCAGCDYGAHPADDWDFARVTAGYLIDYLKQNVASGMIWDAYDSFYQNHNSWGYWGLLKYNPPVGILGHNNNLGLGIDNADSNYIDANKVTVGTSPATVTSISVYVASSVDPAPNNQYQVAIYTDNGGKPGTLVAKSQSGTLTANAWNALPISATLNANTVYWLAYNTNGTSPSSNNLKYEPGPSGIQAYTNTSSPFGTWPTTFPSSSLSSALFSMYASLSQGSPFGTYTPTPRFYTDAQIYKYVLPGDVRVDASTTLSGVNLVAFSNQAAGRITIVGRNSNTSSQTINGVLNNLPSPSSLQLYQTTQASNMARYNDVPVSNGAFSVTVAADSVFTLTTTAYNVSPTMPVSPTLTPVVTNTPTPILTSTPTPLNTPTPTLISTPNPSSIITNAPIPTPGGTTNIGYTNIGDSVDSADSNYIDGNKITTGSTAETLRSISVYVDNVDPAPNNQYQVAIYTNSSGKPKTLIAKSQTGTLIANDWNTLPIVATLSANTTYWLTYNTNGTTASSNNIHYNPGSSGMQVYTNNVVSFSTWPSTFPTSTLANLQFSMYATVTP